MDYLFFSFDFFHGLARPSCKVQDLLASKRCHAARSCRALLPVSLQPSNLPAPLLIFQCCCIPSSLPIFLYPFQFSNLPATLPAFQSSCIPFSLPMLLHPFQPSNLPASLPPFQSSCIASSLQIFLHPF